MPKSKADLFIELANPNNQGISRWVQKSEFVGDYKKLYFENGCSWGRDKCPLGKKYKIIRKQGKNDEGHNEIIAIKLNGFNNDLTTQSIRKDIVDKYKNQRCVILGTSHPEIDHKDGRKNDIRVMNTQTQKPEDFQPLSKAANDAKRQFCKECKATNKRYDAKKLGYNVSFIEGDENYNEELGCKGCFWYDPKEFRSKLIKKEQNTGNS